MINAQTLNVIILAFLCYAFLCVQEVDFVLFRAAMTHLHKYFTMHYIYINQEQNKWQIRLEKLFKIPPSINI